MDIYYLIFNESSFVENGLVMEFALMLDRTDFNVDNNLFALTLDFISTNIVEDHFRFSNGGIQTSIFSNMLETLESNGNVALYRGSIHIVNVGTFPLTNGNFRIQANVLSFVTRQTETADTRVVYNSSRIGDFQGVNLCVYLNVFWYTSYI